MRERLRPFGQPVDRAVLLVQALDARAEAKPEEPTDKKDESPIIDAEVVDEPVDTEKK